MLITLLLSYAPLLDSIEQGRMDIQQIAKHAQKIFIDVPRRRTVNENNLEMQDYKKIKFNT